MRNWGLLRDYAKAICYMFPMATTQSPLEKCPLILWALSLNLVFLLSGYSSLSEGGRLKGPKPGQERYRGTEGLSLGETSLGQL